MMIQIIQQASTFSYIFTTLSWEMGWASNMHVFPNPLKGFWRRKGPKRGSPGSAASVYMPFSWLFALLCSTCCSRYIYLVLIFHRLSTTVWLLSVSLSHFFLMNVVHNFPRLRWSWATSTDYREREASCSQRHQIPPTCSVLWSLVTEPSFSLHTLCLLKRGSTAKCSSCRSEPVNTEFSHFLCGCAVLQWTCLNLTFTPDVKAFKADVDKHQ